VVIKVKYMGLLPWKVKVKIHIPKQVGPQEHNLQTLKIIRTVLSAFEDLSSYKELQYP